MQSECELVSATFSAAQAPDIPRRNLSVVVKTLSSTESSQPHQTVHKNFPERGLAWLMRPEWRSSAGYGVIGIFKCSQRLPI